MTKVVAVALSGGVDSAVAAYLLTKEKKYNVFSITFCLDKKISEKFDKEKINTVKKISSFLGIKNIVYDISEIFYHDVITYFKNEYLLSRTPNPCALCNLKIKFGKLLEIAESQGADFIATGHYASVVEKNGIKFISPGRDINKSQDYFLSLLSSETIKKIIFPLSGLLKEDVKKIAETSKIPVKLNNESQDICFVSNQKYHAYLESNFNLKPEQGNIIDRKGNVLAKHKGLFKYTVGQRKNLGFSSSRPYYALEIRPLSNELIVGLREETYIKKILVSPVKWLGEKGKFYFVKIRYRHKPSLAEITRQKDSLLIKFSESQFAPSTGQIATIYDSNNLIVGAGFIEKLLYEN